MKGFICFIAFCSLLVTYNSFADTQQNRLDRLVDQIKQIKNLLQTKSSQSESLQQELKENEIQYSESNKKMQEINAKINLKQQQIILSQNSLSQNNQQLGVQQQALSRQLYLTYLLQRQGSLPILLGQNNLNQSERMLYYYQQLNHYRIKIIQQSQAKLQKLIQTHQELIAQNKALEQLKKQQEDTKNRLKTIGINRSNLLTQINKNISNQQQQLIVLLQNKKNLEQTVEKLSKNFVEPSNFRSKNFASLRGQLPWPAKGSVLHYFGKPISNSELTWNGELIEAAEGQPVYAVASGVVVFSKWLKGYGLLIILYHGDGYMTLYGRNNDLLKHEGDKVNAGEVIAQVGKSGGYEKPALYFAIRYNAKALDPNQWCS